MAKLNLENELNLNKYEQVVKQNINSKVTPKVESLSLTKPLPNTTIYKAPEYKAPELKQPIKQFVSAPLAPLESAKTQEKQIEYVSDVTVNALKQLPKIPSYIYNTYKNVKEVPNQLYEIKDNFLQAYGSFENMPKEQQLKYNELNKQIYSLEKQVKQDKTESENNLIELQKQRINETQQIQNKYQGDKITFLTKFAGDVISSSIDQAPMIAVGMLTEGYGALPFMSLKVYSQSLGEAYNDLNNISLQRQQSGQAPLSQNEIESSAKTYAFIQSAIETASESLVGRIGQVGFLDVTKTNIFKNAVEKFATTELGQKFVQVMLESFGEGAEEIASEIANYMLSGLTYKGKDQRSLLKLTEDSAYAFISAMASTMLTSGVAEGFRFAKENTIQMIASKDNINNLSLEEQDSWIKQNVPTKVVYVDSFENAPEGTKGRYNTENNTIEVLSSEQNKIGTALVHEFIHSIQISGVYEEYQKFVENFYNTFYDKGEYRSGFERRLAEIKQRYGSDYGMKQAYIDEAVAFFTADNMFMLGNDGSISKAMLDYTFNGNKDINFAITNYFNKYLSKMGKYKYLDSLQQEAYGADENVYRYLSSGRNLLQRAIQDVKGKDVVKNRLEDVIINIQSIDENGNELSDKTQRDLEFSSIKNQNKQLKVVSVDINGELKEGYLNSERSFGHNTSGFKEILDNANTYLDTPIDNFDTMSKEQAQKLLDILVLKGFDSLEYKQNVYLVNDSTQYISIGGEKGLPTQKNRLLANLLKENNVDFSALYPFSHQVYSDFSQESITNNPNETLEKLDALQLEIEFYNQDGYEESERQRALEQLTNLKSYIAQIKSRFNSSDIHDAYGNPLTKNQESFLNKISKELKNEKGLAYPLTYVSKDDAFNYETSYEQSGRFGFTASTSPDDSVRNGLYKDFLVQEFYYNIKNPITENTQGTISQKTWAEVIDYYKDLLKEAVKNYDFDKENKNDFIKAFEYEIENIKYDLNGLFNPSQSEITKNALLSSGYTEEQIKSDLSKTPKDIYIYNEITRGLFGYKGDLALYLIDGNKKSFIDIIRDTYGFAFSSRNLHVPLFLKALNDLTGYDGVITNYGENKRVTAFKQEQMVSINNESPLKKSKYVDRYYLSYLDDYDKELVKIASDSKNYSEFLYKISKNPSVASQIMVQGVVDFYEGRMLFERVKLKELDKNVKLMSVQDSYQLFENSSIKQKLRYDWGVKGNNLYKPDIFDYLISDVNLRSAFLSIMYANYLYYKKIKQSDLPFEKFLNTPIKLYRGQRPTKMIDENDRFVSYTFDLSTAKDFASFDGGSENWTSNIDSITVKPIDTFGSYVSNSGNGFFSEFEVLVPRPVVRQKSRILRYMLSGYSEEDINTYRTIYDLNKLSEKEILNVENKTENNIKEMFYGEDVQMIDVRWLTRLSENNRLLEYINKNLSKERINNIYNDILENGIKESLIIEYNPNNYFAKLGEGNHRLGVALMMGLTKVPARMVRSGYMSIQEGGFVFKEGDFKPNAVNGTWFGSTGKPLDIIPDLSNFDNYKAKLFTYINNGTGKSDSGKELTANQIEFFKDANPIAFDEKGNLRTFYHTTNDDNYFETIESSNRTAFGTPALFLTDNQTMSSAYNDSKISKVNFYYGKEDEINKLLDVVAYYNGIIDVNIDTEIENSYKKTYEEYLQTGIYWDKPSLEEYKKIQEREINYLKENKDDFVDKFNQLLSYFGFEIKKIQKKKEYMSTYEIIESDKNVEDSYEREEIKYYLKFFKDTENKDFKLITSLSDMILNKVFLSSGNQYHLFINTKNPLILDFRNIDKHYMWNNMNIKDIMDNVLKDNNQVEIENFIDAYKSYLRNEFLDNLDYYSNSLKDYFSDTQIHFIENLNDSELDRIFEELSKTEIYNDLTSDEKEKIKKLNDYMYEQLYMFNEDLNDINNINYEKYRDISTKIFNELESKNLWFTLGDLIGKKEYSKKEIDLFEEYIYFSILNRNMIDLVKDLQKDFYRNSKMTTNETLRLVSLTNASKSTSFDSIFFRGISDWGFNALERIQEIIGVDGNATEFLKENRADVVVVLENGIAKDTENKNPTNDVSFRLMLNGVSSVEKIKNGIEILTNEENRNANYNYNVIYDLIKRYEDGGNDKIIESILNSSKNYQEYILNNPNMIESSLIDRLKAFQNEYVSGYIKYQEALYEIDLPLKLYYYIDENIAPYINFDRFTSRSPFNKNEGNIRNESYYLKINENDWEYSKKILLDEKNDFYADYKDNGKKSEYIVRVSTHSQNITPIGVEPWDINIVLNDNMLPKIDYEQFQKKNNFEDLLKEKLSEFKVSNKRPYVEEDFIQKNSPVYFDSNNNQINYKINNILKDSKARNKYGKIIPLIKVDLNQNIYEKFGNVIKLSNDKNLVSIPYVNKNIKYSSTYAIINNPVYVGDFNSNLFNDFFKLEDENFKNAKIVSFANDVEEDLSNKKIKLTYSNKTMLDLIKEISLKDMNYNELVSFISNNIISENGGLDATSDVVKSILTKIGYDGIIERNTIIENNAIGDVGSDNFYVFNKNQLISSTSPIKYRNYVSMIKATQKEIDGFQKQLEDYFGTTEIAEDGTFITPSGKYLDTKYHFEVQNVGMSLGDTMAVLGNIRYRMNPDFMQIYKRPTEQQMDSMIAILNKSESDFNFIYIFDADNPNLKIYKTSYYGIDNIEYVPELKEIKYIKGNEEQFKKEISDYYDTTPSLFSKPIDYKYFLGKDTSVDEYRQSPKELKDNLLKNYEKNDNRIFYPDSINFKRAIALSEKFYRNPNKFEIDRANSIISKHKDYLSEKVINDTKDKFVITEKILSDTKDALKNGGFTINSKGEVIKVFGLLEEKDRQSSEGRPLEDKKYVAVRHVYETGNEKINKDSPDEELLKEYLRVGFANLRFDDEYVGGWVDNGKFYLDISVGIDGDSARIDTHKVAQIVGNSTKTNEGNTEYTYLDGKTGVFIRLNQDDSVDKFINNVYGGAFINSPDEIFNYIKNKTNLNIEKRSFQQTVVESGIYPMLEKRIDKLVETGEADYLVASDKDAIAYVEQDLDIKLTDTREEVLAKLEKAKIKFLALVDSGKRLSKNEFAISSYLLKMYNEYRRPNDFVEILSAVNEVYTEYGQGIQSASLINKLSGQGQFVALQRLIKKIESQYANKDKRIKIKLDENLTNQLIGELDLERINEIMDKIKDDVASQLPSTFMDKANAWRYLSMLGNPLTHMRNLLGNMAMTPLMASKDLIGTVLESGIIPKDEKTKSVINPLSSNDKALLDFARTQYDAFVKNAEKQGKYDERSDIMQRRAIFKTKALESLRTGVSDLLDSSDMWFQKLNFVNAYAQAMKARGIRVDSITSKQNLEITEYAIQQAKIATFRDANKLATILNSAEKSGKVSGFLIASMIPFKKTPLNILKRAYEFSPLSILGGLYYLNEVKKGNMDATVALDKMASGLSSIGILALGAFLFNAGILNVGSDKEETEKEYLYNKALGMQRYSINIFGGTYTISWLAPAIIPLIIGGEIQRELTNLNKNDSLFNYIPDALVGAFDPIFELTLLQGLTQSLNSYSQGFGVVSDIISSASANYVSQFVPSFFGQIARTIDKTRRSTYVPNPTSFSGYVEQTMRKLANKIPFASQYNEPMVDIKGNVIEQDENPFIRALLNLGSVGYYQPININAQDREIKRIYELIKDGKVIPRTAPKTVAIDGEDYDLTPSQYTSYSKILGEQSYKILKSVISMNGYNRLSTEDKANIIYDIYEYASSSSKDSLYKDLGKEYKDTSYENINKAQKYGINIADYLITKRIFDTLKSDEFFSKKEKFIEYLTNAGYKNYLYEYLTLVGGYKGD